MYTQRLPERSVAAHEPWFAKLTSAHFVFILTSMGDLCSEGHEFIRACRSRECAKAELLLDVLVTQHSRWTERRIHRALIGQSLMDFGSWNCLSSQTGKSKISNRCQNKKCAMLSNKFTRQFTCPMKAGRSAEIFSREEGPAIADTPSNDESESDAEEEGTEHAVSRRSGSVIHPDFSGIRTDGKKGKAVAPQ